MPTLVDGLSVSLPHYLRREVSTAVFRVAASQPAPSLAGGKVLAPPRTNLVIVRRRLSEPARLADGVEQCRQELRRSLPQLSEVVTTPLTFADGVDGSLLRYTFPHEGLQIVQLKAVRADGPLWTELTVTATAASLSAEDEAALVSALLTARDVADGS